MSVIDASAMQAVQINIQQDAPGARTVFVAPQQVAEGGWEKLVGGDRVGVDLKFGLCSLIRQSTPGRQGQVFE